jgi:divalent metal cation (Fe/Co/Zn/Cd) transporter
MVSGACYGVVSGGGRYARPGMTDVALPLPDVERRQLVRRAQLLAWSSLVIITLEGVIGIAAGIAAGSIALIGFGIDSAIEGLASVIVIWRFWGARGHSETAERRAQQLVAVSFFLLAPYIAIEAVRALVGGDESSLSWVGIGLALMSLLLMPWLGVAKQRVGRRLGSTATAGEGTQNILCAFMAAALLAGLLANAVLGWWWADPVAALVIAGIAVREGQKAWRGDECC